MTLVFGDKREDRPVDPVQVDRNRATFMEVLYQNSGRTERSHPLHGRLTGLYEEFCLLIGRQVVGDLVENYPSEEDLVELQLEHSVEVAEPREAA